MSMKNDQKIFNQGMAFAYRIFKEQGEEGLEREIRSRGLVNLPLNISRKQLVEVSEVVERELRLTVATASCMAMVEDMKIPPSVVKDYLHHFNRRAREYGNDKELRRQAEEWLSRNIAFTQICEEYEEEQDGNE